MKPNLTHIALHVKDVEACIRFYEDYCGMRVIHERPHDGQRLVWMAEEGREKEFIFVLLPFGKQKAADAEDFGHLGFAVESRARVDEIAARAKRNGHLVWEPREEPWPVGYYIGLKDPNGNYVEFSYGQPLGPGADDVAAPDS